VLQPFSGADSGLPSQDLAGAGDIRATLSRVVLGEGLVDEPAGAAGELQDEAVHLSYGVLDRVAEVYGTRLGAPHEAADAFHEVVHVLQAPGLGSATVDGQRLTGEGLVDEVGDQEASVVRAHPGTVGVEDAGYSRLYSTMAMAGSGGGLRVALGLVIDGANAYRVDVPPILLVLGMDEWIAVYLTRRGEHEAGASVFRKIQGIVSTQRACLEDLQRDALEVLRARRGGEVLARIIHEGS